MHSRFLLPLCLDVKWNELQVVKKQSFVLVFFMYGHLQVLGLLFTAAFKPLLLRGFVSFHGLS
eukprot:2830540-Amphidinium_carterae.1